MDMDLAGMKRRELQALCKRHGLAAGGSNAELVARLDAALSGAAGAEEEVARVPARKGCLKPTGGDAAEAKKVTFAAEEGKARRLRSRVVWSPDAPKTRGKSAAAGADFAAEDGTSTDVGADVLVRRSRRNSVSGAEAEEVGEAVAVDRKRKRQKMENDEGIDVSSQVGVSSRVTRRLSLAGAVAVLPPAVEKKRGRGKAAAGSNKPAAEPQDSEPEVQNSAQVEVSARVTRSRTTVPVVMSPTVVGNKRRKTGDAQTNVELSTVSDVPRNDAPATRSLRNRVVQANNNMVDETHTARQLENKTQPSRPPTRRHQQVSSSVEDKSQEQVAAPNKAPVLRRSGRNHSEDAEKQPAVKEPVKRPTRKSVVLATCEKEENDLIEEKNPEAHVRRSTRKSIVPVKDVKGVGEEIQNANSEDAVKQPATKGPARVSRRKSVVPELHEKEKGLTAEKNMEAHEGRSMRKPVIPVKDNKAVGEGIQNAKGKAVEKQFVVKQPTRRSSRKSVLPGMLENNSGLLAAEMNDEMNVRRSTRKSVLPNMLNEENQDHSKITRKENIQSGKCQDNERQQKVKEPIRRSRRAVAAVPLEEQNNDGHEEKMSVIPMRKSTRKSVALNVVEKVCMDHTEIVAREPERVGEEGLKLRKHRRSSLEISSANDSWRKQQNAQMPNEKDNTGGTQQASNSTTLKGRSSKRRRTTAPEEVMSVKEANDDIIISEASKDAYQATNEYKESSSGVLEFGQVNATREETLTLTDEVFTAQSVPVVIPGSESGDIANESSDKSKQEHSDIQAVDCHLSETSGELDQSSGMAGQVLHNSVVSEDKALMSKDGLSINFTVGDHGEQSPISGEGRVDLEANTSESGEKNLSDIMSTGLYPKSFQHDIEIIAEETGKVAEESIRAADLGKCPSSPSKGNPLLTSVHLEGAADDNSLSDGRPLSFDLESMFAEDCKESYSRNAENTAVQKDDGNKTSTPVISGFYVGSECVEDEDLQPTECDADKKHDVDEDVAEVLAEKSNDELAGPGTESGCSITEKDTGLVADILDEQAIILVQQCDVQDDDLEKPSPCSAKPDCKHECGLPEENTAVEFSGGIKPSTQVTPDFYAGSDCLQDEDVQPTEYDAAKKLDVEESVAEEVLAEEKSNDQHVPAKTELNLNLNDELAGPGTESGCSIAEKDTRLFDDIHDQQAIILVQHGDVQYGDLEKPSPCSATPDCKHECGLPEENTAVDFSGGIKPSTLVTPDFYVGSDCLQDEDVQPTEYDAAKKLDVEESVAEEVLAEEKSNDQHVFAKTELNLKLNDELAGPGTESGCSITEKDTRLSDDILDRQAIILVQQGDVQDGDLEKPSSYSATPELHEFGLPEENTVVEIGGGNKLSTQVTPDFYAGSDCLQDDVQPTECDADKNLDVEGGVAKEAEEKSNDQHVLAKDELNMKLYNELSGPCMESGCSITEKDTRPVADILDQQDTILVQQAGVQEGDLEKLSICSATPECKHECGLSNEKTAVEIGGVNNPSTPMTPDLSVGSDCLEDQDVQPSVCYADKKLDVDQGVTEEALDQEKSNDQHVPAKTDLYMKLNDELAGPSMESGCSIIQKNARLFSDNFDIIQVQHGDVQEGDLKKPLSCSATPEYKHRSGLPEETILSGKNTGSLSGAEQSPFGLESLFLPENIDEYMGSATAHTKNGFDDSIDCHVKSALENAHSSEPFSHDDTEEGISKNDDCMQTSQQENGMEEANLDEERVLSVFSLDAMHIKEVMNSEEVACEGEGSQKLAQSEEQNTSSEKTDVNGPDCNSYGITDAALSSQLHTPASDNYEICLGLNIDVLHQGHDDQCSDGTEERFASNPCTHDIIEDASTKYIESGVLLHADNERSNLEDGQLNSKLDGAKVVESGCCFNEDTGDILGSGSVGEITPFSSGLSKDSSVMNRQEVLDGFSVETSLEGSSTCGEKIVCRVDAIENPSISSATPGCKHEGALSEEATRALKNYAGTCSSKPRELLTELQSPFSMGNIIESELHDGLAFPSAENSGDESIDVEQRVKVQHDSDLSHFGSTNLLDELIGCSNTEVLRLGHNHKDPSNVDRAEQVDDAVDAAAAAKCIENELVLVPSEERSNMNDGQLNSKLESPNTMCLVDPKRVLMDLQSLHSEGSTGKSDLQDNIAFPSAESGRDGPIVCHVEKIIDTRVSSETDAYQGPCQDLSRHEEKESCMSVPVEVKKSGVFLRSSHMKGSLTSVEIDLADDAHLIERDIVAEVEVLCEEKVERKSMPTPDSDILQEKSYSKGHGICQSHSQKHIVEANSMLSSCGTEVLHQDHKEECTEPIEGKFSPKALDENNMTEDAPIEGMESSIMMPLVAGISEIPDEQLKTKISEESEELSFSCDKDTIENFCTGPAKRDLYLLPKDFHVDSCQKQDDAEVLSLPKSPEESAKIQYVSVSGSGPCQQHVNESSSMQVTYNVEMLNLDHDNQNNEDQTTSCNMASSVPETVEIVQSEMEIGLIPAAEASMLPVPDEQLNNKLEDNEVNEQSFSYDKDLSSLFDTDFLGREASNLHEDDCMDLSSEGNHATNDPAPRSPEQSAYFQNDDLGSVGSCQSSRQIGIDELGAKLQSFKVSSTVKGSYIAMSAPRPKPGDSMSQSAIALLRNIENTTAVKAGRPVKPKADGKDSSRRALQPISGRPREH